MTELMKKNGSIQYLDAMGITVWVRRQSAFSLPEQTGFGNESVTASSKFNQPTENSPTITDLPGSQPTEVANPSTVKIDWETLQNQVTKCTACELHQTRTQAVLGVGNRQADWMLIGEAPGAEEDAQGEPFVGRAGQLLNAMLYAIGLHREEVYIANVVKCRPPDNRNPKLEEANCCDTFLQQQIALIKPKLIIALGGIAAQHLLTTDKRIGQLRGQRFDYAHFGIPVIATYHPAYLLRRPTEKRRAWQDLQFICQHMAELKS